jgi:hypothetical protein
METTKGALGRTKYTNKKPLLPSMANIYSPNENGADVKLNNTEPSSVT